MVSARQYWFHQKCAQHVLDYVSTNLGEEFELRRMADIAGFSRAYLHRMFKRVTGENLFRSIRRLRLEAAAARLMTDPCRPIVDIAFETGFSSQPVFARQFHAHFGMSASEWRDGEFWWYNGSHWDWRGSERHRPPKTGGNGRIAGAWRGYYLDHAMADAADGRRPASLGTITLTELPASDISCLRLQGIDGHAHACSLRRALRRWIGQQDSTLRVGTAILRLRSNPTIVLPAHLRYDFGLSVDDGTVTSPALDRQTIPGGLYLLAESQGTNLETEYLYQYWMPMRGLKPDASRPLQVRARIDNGNVAGAFQTCIPVARTSHAYRGA